MFENAVFYTTTGEPDTRSRDEALKELLLDYLIDMNAEYGTRASRAKATLDAMKLITDVFEETT